MAAHAWDEPRTLLPPVFTLRHHRALPYAELRLAPTKETLILDSLLLQPV